MVTWKKISGDRANGWLWNIVALASKCSLRFDQEHDFLVSTDDTWLVICDTITIIEWISIDHWMNVHLLRMAPFTTIVYITISVKEIYHIIIYIYREIGKWYIDISQSIRKSLTVKQGHPRCSTNKKQTLQEVTEQVYASASCRSGSSRRVPHW
jgi:hypothetical protein